MKAVCTGRPLTSTIDEALKPLPLTVSGVCATELTEFGETAETRAIPGGRVGVAVAPSTGTVVFVGSGTWVSAA